MLDAHAYVMQVKLCEANTQGVTPFMIKEVTRPTSYRLAHLDGTDVPNSWHIDKLRHFYA